MVIVRFCSRAGTYDTPKSVSIYRRCASFYLATCCYFIAVLSRVYISSEQVHMPAWQEGEEDYIHPPCCDRAGTQIDAPVPSASSFANLKLSRWQWACNTSTVRATQSTHRKALLLRNVREEQTQRKPPCNVFPHHFHVLGEVLHANHRTHARRFGTHTHTKIKQAGLQDCDGTKYTPRHGFLSCHKTEWALPSSRIGANQQDRAPSSE